MRQYESEFYEPIEPEPLGGSVENYFNLLVTVEQWSAFPNIVIATTCLDHTYYLGHLKQIIYN
jgi:hypothetical protein